MDAPNRRQFLAGGTLAAAWLAAAPLSAEDQQAAAAPHIPTDRTVYLASDWPPVPPETHLRLLGTALAKFPGREDNYLKGGAVTALEEKFAAMFGKEDCCFLPTGTLANNLAVRLLAGEHKHIITQQDSHLYADESDSPSILSGLTMQPIAAGKAAPSPEEFEAAVTDAEHRAYPLKVGAISIESPVRRHDGETVPMATVEKVCAMAKAKGIGTHWDGARAFMMLGTPGFSLAGYAAHFDTVFASLYKALHAPFGAMLCGSKETVARARDLRHVCGGLIYHGWVAALPALYALDGLEGRWVKARAAAEEVLAGLGRAGFSIQRRPHESNIVYVKAPAAVADTLQAKLEKSDITVRMLKDGAMQFFINETILRRTPDEIVRAFLA